MRTRGVEVGVGFGSLLLRCVTRANDAGEIGKVSPLRREGACPICATCRQEGSAIRRVIKSYLVMQTPISYTHGLGNKP